jgi:hypothetical protein
MSDRAEGILDGGAGPGAGGRALWLVTAAVGLLLTLLMKPAD